MNDSQQGMNTPDGVQGTDTDVMATSQQTGSGTTVGAGAQQGYTTNASGEVVVPEYAEELVPETVEQQEGVVHVHKDVVQEQQTVSAPVTREEVEVERVPVNQPVGSAPPDAFQEQDLDIPLRREELVADKRVVEAEEVRLHKQQVQEQEQVTGTVRREEIEVDQPTQATSTDTMATAQATPVQATTTNVDTSAASTMQATPIQTTTATITPVEDASATVAPIQGSTSGMTLQGSETVVQGGAMQPGTTSTTYRIEAEPVQDTLQTTDGTAQAAAQGAGGTAQGAAQNAGDKIQQGAGDAKGKIDSAIDSVTDKLLGRDH